MDVVVVTLTGDDDQYNDGENLLSTENWHLTRLVINMNILELINNSQYF